MKKLLLIALLGISFQSFGQGNWSLSSAKNRWANGMGFGNKDTSTYTNASDTNLLVLQNPGILCYRHLTTDHWEILSYNSTVSNYKLIADSLFDAGYTRRDRNQWGLDSLGNLKVNISDTSTMLNPYLRKSDTAAMLIPFVQYSDTANMLSPYARTSNLNFINNQTGSTLSAQTAKFWITDSIRTSGVFRNGGQLNAASGSFIADIDGIKVGTSSSDGGVVNIKQGQAETLSGTGYTSLYTRGDTSINYYFGTSGKIVSFGYENLTASRSFLYPNTSGTIALTSDIPVSGSFTNRRIPFSNSLGQLKDTTGFTFTGSGDLNIPNSINTASGNFSSTINIGVTSNNGVLNLNNTSATQAAFYGYSDFGVNRSGSGKINLGSNGSFQGTIQYYDGGSTVLYVDNTFDNPGSLIKLRLRTNGTPVDALTLFGTGQATFSSSVTASSFATSGGTSSQFLKADGSVDATVTSGKYLPTATGISNVSATSADSCQYMRIGNVVTVSGKINVTPTSGTTSTTVTVSLPIASTFTSISSCAGSGNWTAGSSQNMPVAIEGAVSGTAANFYFYSDGGLGSRFLPFTFTYTIE